jgi:hypothetical protein
MGLAALTWSLIGEFPADSLWANPVALAVLVSSLLLLAKACRTTALAFGLAMLLAGGVAIGLLVFFGGAALRGHWLLLKTAEPDVFRFVHAEILFSIAMLAWAVLSVLLLVRSRRAMRSRPDEGAASNSPSCA